MIKTDIHKAGAIIIVDGKLLVERSIGKEHFIAPGGKVEPGETVPQALVRELLEECAITVDESDLEFFGRFSAIAAGNTTKTLTMDVYTVTHWLGDPKPSSEVEELRWVGKDLPSDIKFGSIFEHDVIPCLIQRGLLT